MHFLWDQGYIFFTKNFKRNEMTRDKIAINNAAALSPKYNKKKNEI